MINIIDYGMGNLGSILNMFKKIGKPALVSAKIEDLEQASKLVLPGVGAFDQGMNNLKKLGLLPVLNDLVINHQKPILGICLGMQLFSNKSEEGIEAGLGWINAETIRFKFDSNNNNLKIPHMGWNLLNVAKDSVLFQDMYPEPRFYFVHAYHVVCQDKSDVVTTTYHGLNFTSAIQKNNIYGVQFHPEKSHKFGMKLLNNFANL